MEKDFRANKYLEQALENFLVPAAIVGTAAEGIFKDVEPVVTRIVERHVTGPAKGVIYSSFEKVLLRR